ncbi:MAG TPA: FtsQ-type POTRA domain-containing protein, partial [Chloroflexota bacterium]|nr:FtsQ-type POTRA domain-containing protein [Chloroflexota bacterium]
MARREAAVRRPRVARRPVTAAQRAIRAAAPRDPWLPPGFLGWLLLRVMGLGLLVLTGWVVYDSATSDRFQVRSVRVQGSVLLSRAEIENAAAVAGANVFWVDRGQVAARLRSLPLVQRVEVSAALPDTVEISIVERQPAAFWVSGERSYLVDGEGVILKAVDVETQQARACAGQPCDPRLAPLPTVAQLDGPPLTPGDRVDVGALNTSARLATLLPGVGVEPLAFEWTHDFGLEVPTRDGWRVRFDGQSNVDQQVASLRTIRDELVRTKTTAE